MRTDSPKIFVKDIMTKSVISVDASMTVNEAAKMMENSKVGSVVVMENNQPIGIMTDRDFAIKIAAHAYPIFTKIKQVMSTPLISVRSDELAWHAADKMYSNKIRTLPVVKDDEVVGVITATDLVNQLVLCSEEDLKKMYEKSVIKIYDW